MIRSLPYSPTPGVGDKDYWIGRGALKMRYSVLMLTLVVICGCSSEPIADQGTPDSTTGTLQRPPTSGSSGAAKISPVEWPSLGALDKPIDLRTKQFQRGATTGQETRHPKMFHERFNGFITSGVVSSLRKDNVLKPGVLAKHYPHLRINGHFAHTGAFVYYLPERDVFYFSGDCVMNHIDLTYGPFQGDPKVVLKKVVGR